MFLTQTHTRESRAWYQTMNTKMLRGKKKVSIFLNERYKKNNSFCMRGKIGYHIDTSMENSKVILSSS